jgi:hypothetical protein
MGLDYEDNPNLQTAPSGNVETPAVPYQPAVAPQAAIPAQPAMQLTNEEKNKKLVEIMMSQNPYASPVAKLMYESLEKQNSGPLAEYRLAQQQGYKGTMKDYQIEQSLAKRPPPNNTVVNMPHGAAQIGVDPVTKELFYFQTGPNGKIARVEGAVPVPKETDLKQKLADAGIYPNLPDGTPNPEYTKYAKALLSKDTNITVAPSSSTTNAEGVTTQAAPVPEKGMVNVTIDGKVKAIPIEDFNKLNAARISSETKASESVKNEYDFETVPDPKGSGAKVLMSKTEIARLAALGTPVVSQIDLEKKRGENVLSLAARAQTILPKATSGLISNLFTMATDAAGIPTDKSAADGKLKVIGAGLTASVPRMEGSQSNADLLEYKQAAADIANSNIPYQKRLAALETVITLNEKYASTPVAPPPGAVRRITPRVGPQ